jgi:hypothetical protein
MYRGMKVRAFSLLSAALACGSLFSALVMPAQGAAPKLSGKPTAAEAPFVAAMSADLSKRFATVADAEKAGYLRYTNEDDTGAISYANCKWSSVDAQHPSQLWYDAKGRLIGADFSVLIADSPKAPVKWGVDPSRWQKFDPAHYHFALAGADGTPIYGALGVGPKGGVGGEIERTPGKPTEIKVPAAKAALVKADLAKLSPQAVVDAGFAKSAGEVKFFFEFPALWDLIVWVVPNPSGAFAEKNPNVKPVNPPKSSGM